MFVQISHGNKRNQRKGIGDDGGSPAGRRFEDHVAPAGAEGETEPEEPKMDGGRGDEANNSVAVLEISEGPEVGPSSGPGPRAGRSEQILGRIGEKASKYLPKRGSLSKFFGEREPDITVYTIDREMNKSKCQRGAAQRQKLAKNPEILDKLQRTKQVPVKQEADGQTGRFTTVGVQASPYPPFRLHFLPNPDWRDEDSKYKICLKFVSCLCSLACIFLFWILLGALVFYLTEGPWEYEKAIRLNESQSSLAASLETDLQVANTDGPVWQDTIDQYVERHEQMVLDAAHSGYFEDGDLWSYSGSFLYAISLLAVLGLGSPALQTVSGKVFAGFFMIFGLPLHVLLICNAGLAAAVQIHLAAKELELRVSQLKRRLQRGGGDGEDKEEWPEELFVSELYPPGWVRYLPLVSVPVYYLVGVLVFGLGRDMEFPGMLGFPGDFTVSGGLAYSGGLARFAYALYLEGALLLASVSVAVLRLPSARSALSKGITLGLLTNSLD